MMEEGDERKAVTLPLFDFFIPCMCLGEWVPQWLGWKGQMGRGGEEETGRWEQSVCRTAKGLTWCSLAGTMLALSPLPLSPFSALPWSQTKGCLSSDWAGLSSFSSGSPPSVAELVSCDKLEVWFLRSCVFNLLLCEELLYGQVCSSGHFLRAQAEASLLVGCVGGTEAVFVLQAGAVCKVPGCIHYNKSG